jgi:hypothetical protein
MTKSADLISIDFFLPKKLSKKNSRRRIKKKLICSKNVVSVLLNGEGIMIEIIEKNIPNSVEDTVDEK